MTPELSLVLATVIAACSHSLVSVRSALAPGAPWDALPSRCHFPMARPMLGLMLAQWVQDLAMGASWRSWEQSQNSRTSPATLARCKPQLCSLPAATHGNGKAGKAAGMEGSTQAPGVTASPSSWDTGCYGNEGCINTGHQSARIPRLRKAGRRVNDSPRGQTLSHPSEESREGFPLLPARSSSSAALGCVLPHRDVLPWPIGVYEPICLFYLPPLSASRAHEDKMESGDGLSDTHKHGPTGSGGSECRGWSESASR